MSNNGVGIFLDRDGTINKDVNYLTSADQLSLIPRSAEAINKFNSMNIPVFVVTNQSAIAHELITENQLHEIHDSLQTMLKKENAFITHFYYCPHFLTGLENNYSIDCNCRKPKSGMLEKAKSDYGIEFTSSFMVGDKLIDVQTGANVGMKSFLVETGYGLKHKSEAAPFANYIVEDLFEASTIIEKLLS